MKKPGSLLTDTNELENTLLPMLETLKDKDNKRQKWLEIESQSLKKR